MRNTIKFLLLVFVIGFISCRETKKEVEESDVEIEKTEKIETIKTEVNEITEEIEKESKELENELDKL